MRHDPGVAGHIGNRIVACDEGPVGELSVEHAIEPVGFLDVALDRIRDLVGRILREVVVLSGHRTKAAHLPEQPFQCVGAAARVARQEPAGLFGEIDKDRPAFKNGQRRTTVGGRMVDDGRHAVVRCDLQEIGLELLALADIDRHDAIGMACLFQKDGDLVPVGRRPIVKVDHAVPRTAAECVRVSAQMPLRGRAFRRESCREARLAQRRLGRSGDAFDLAEQAFEIAQHGRESPLKADAARNAPDNVADQRR